MDKNNTAGMWTVDNQSPPLTCVNEAETELEPRGSCSKIGEKKPLQLQVLAMILFLLIKNASIRDLKNDK